MGLIPMYFLTILWSCLLVSCIKTGSEISNQPEILVDSEGDIKQVLDDYRSAWLANDSAEVMSYISDSAIFYRPSAEEKALTGKDQIARFWFSESTSHISYPVFEYELTYRGVEVVSALAVVEGTSLLSWYRLENEIKSDTSTALTEFISIMKKEGSEWKLYRQVYHAKSEGFR